MDISDSNDSTSRKLSIIKYEHSTRKLLECYRLLPLNCSPLFILNPARNCWEHGAFTVLGFYSVAQVDDFNSGTATMQQCNNATMQSESTHDGGGGGGGEERRRRRRRRNEGEMREK